MFLEDRLHNLTYSLFSFLLDILSKSTIAATTVRLLSIFWVGLVWLYFLECRFKCILDYLGVIHQLNIDIFDSFLHLLVRLKVNFEIKHAVFNAIKQLLKLLSTTMITCCGWLLQYLFNVTYCLVVKVSSSIHGPTLSV